MAEYDNRKSEQGLIIEFLGSPGAGKSSLIPELIRYLHMCGMPALTFKKAILPFSSRTLPGKMAGMLPGPFGDSLSRRLFRLRSSFARREFFQQNRELRDIVLSSQRQRPAEVGVRQRKIIHQFYQLAGYYALLKGEARSEDVLIFDEGFVHKVVQLFASDVEEPDPFHVTDYLDLLPRPDLVVFVRAPLGVCEHRLIERGLWRHYQNKTHAQIHRFIATAHRVVHLSVEHMVSKGWPVIEIDNGQPNLAPAVRQLHQKMDAFLIASSRHPWSGFAFTHPAQQA